jgi:hypothetical protein
MKELTSLEGSPEKVGGNFKCYENPNLVSMEGCTQDVGGDFDCGMNRKLSSLKGSPRIIKGYFNAERNLSLTSLEGGPEKVKDDFSISNEKSLKSLKGLPKNIGGGFYLGATKIKLNEKGFLDGFKKRPDLFASFVSPQVITDWAIQNPLKFYKIYDYVDPVTLEGILAKMGLTREEITSLKNVGDYGFFDD